MNLVKRNSGATLQPAMIKQGDNAVEQGQKMGLHPGIFAPVLGFWKGGYVMPMLSEREPEDGFILGQALTKLCRFWFGDNVARTPNIDRWRHHNESVEPLAKKGLMKYQLRSWALSVAGKLGVQINNVHGDATTENIMVYQGEAVWIDPSTRLMPLEAEFDGGKLLQTYFGYNGARPNPLVMHFIRSQNMDKWLCGYYLMTHLVRLYKVQPQAREWALNLAGNLNERLDEAWACKL